MNPAAMFEEIRQRHRYATPDDIRNAFGDYHNALNWLAFFLVENEELAEACVIDACTIATINTPDFHEWLVYWALRATFRFAFQKERSSIAELASNYEKGEQLVEEHPPLLAEQFHQLIRHSEEIQSRLDVLGRFVLVMRGIAKDSYHEVAKQLGISQTAVERSYRLAIELIGDFPSGRPVTRVVRSRRSKEKAMKDHHCYLTILISKLLFASVLHAQTSDELFKFL